MLALARFALVVKAFGACGRYLSRSGGQLARKTLAFALVEIIAVTSSVSLVSGPVLPVASKYGTSLSGKFASLLAEEAGTPWLNENLSSSVIPPIASRSPLSLSSSLSKTAANASPAILPKAAPGISPSAGLMVGGAFFQAGTTPPGISGLQPNSGSPGTAVTITGAHFGSVQGSGLVTFNGATATISSWSDSAIVAAIPTGATTGNVVVTTGTGLASGAPLFTVLNPGLSIDQVVSAQGNTNAGSVATPSFSTNSANEVLVAFVASAQNQTGAISSISSVTGGGLTWVLAERSNASGGTAEIWRAFAPTALNNVSVTAAPANPTVSSDVVLTVASFIGADITGTNGSGAIGAMAQATAPSAALTTTRNNSLVFAVGADAKNPATVTAGTNQNILNILTNQVVGTCVPPAGCTPVPGDMLWVQQVDTAIAASGTTVSLSDTTSPNDVVDFSVVEILPAATPSTAPLITSLSSISGAPGNVITISGANFGAVQGSSTVTFNGIAASPTSWSANSIVAPVPATATTGKVVVNTGQASNVLRFVVTNTAGLGIDQTVFVDVTTDDIGVSITPTFSTVSGNQLLLAYVSASAIGSPVTVTSVTGGGLTWTLVKRTNTQAGTAEIWRAFSPFILSNAAVTVNLVNNLNTSVTVVGYLGVDITGTNGSGAIGALGTGSAATGAPSATLVSTRKNSMVYGVGIDPNSGVVRAPASGQSLIHQITNVCVNQSPFICLNGSNNTSWVQQLNGSVSTVGMSVNINDTAPTTDPFNLSLVEVLPPGVATPVITSLSPSSGPIGTSVTIAGSNFGSSQGASSVTFGGVGGIPTSWTATAIVVPVPSGVPPGAASVVVNVSGAGASKSLPFTVIVPLAVTASVSPGKVAPAWNNFNVTISYQCTGGVAPVQCPASQTVTTEGAGQTFTGTATDANGTQASFPTTLNIDKTNPLVSITSPANNISVSSSVIQVTGSASDALSGISTVTCNGVAATISAGNYSCSVTLAPGPNTITVAATDVALNIASHSVPVTLGPTITDFTPKAGPTGTAVSILGTNLSIPPNATMVTFAGPTGPLTAKVNFANSTQLAVVVPDTAVTGTITINTSAGSATTAAPFTIGPRQDFSVTLSPATGTATQSSNTSFSVAVTSPQTTFTQLASLSVTGLQTGVIASFIPQQVTAGASSGLTVDLSATNLAPGSYPFIVHAVANIDGKAQERTAAGTLTVIAAGQTTLSGQVLSSANQPIIGASVSIDGVTVLTDGAGRFFLTGIQSGTNRSLSVDGHSATSPNATFPLIFEPVNIIAGRANNVATPFHLPPIDTSQEVTIDPTRDTVAGNASVTNLQMTIPVGAHLRMLDGTLVTRTSITPLAPDRTPAPLPSDVGTNIVFTSQPGGAITDVPIPVVYPNLAGLNPGTRVELYAFDHAHVNWFVYGFGRVSTDGRTIAPEIDPTTGKPYGLKDFSWHFPNTGPNGNPSDPNGCPSTRGPHPVDYATGNKIENVQQVSWGGARGGLTFSLVFTSDKAQICNNCPFGRGWTHNWDIQLSGSFAPGGAGRLIMPYEAMGRLYSSSGTDASGAAKFSTTATTSGLGGVLIIGGSAAANQYRESDGTILNFNSAGRLISKVDRNGNTTTLTYTNGNLTKISDPVGRSLNFVYDSSNRVTSMTDALGRTWFYTYEGTPGVAGTPGLTTITDPGKNVTKYSYVTGGRIASVTDARGNVVKMLTYDVNGRVATQTLADSGTETYSYGLSGTIVSQATITSSVGRKEVRRFDANGYALSVTDNQGQTSTITRDLNTSLPIASTGPCGCGTGTRTFSSTGAVTSATDAGGGQVFLGREPVFNNPVQVTDPLGHVTNLVYDPKGNLLTVTNALNQTTTFTYDAFGELVTVQDPLGNVRHIEYDAVGNGSAVVDALGNRATFTHDVLGRTLTSSDPLGHKTNFQYDALGHVASYTDAAGSATGFAYDANGNLTTTTNALGQTIQDQFDAKNRLVSITDAIGRITKLSFTTDNELSAVVAPSGRRLSFTTDSGGLLSGISDPSAASISFSHDSAGRMTALTDQRGNAATVTYDVVGRPISRTDASGRTTTATYDLAGNISKVIDRFGRQTAFTRDVLNRVTSINFPDAVVSYTYDAAGRISRVDDSQSGFVQFAYDANGQTISETTPAGTVQYSYDTSGRVISVAPGSRPLITYGYDLAGRLTSITRSAGVFNFSYDSLSRRSSLQRPNGVITNYTYDGAGRIARLTHLTSGQTLEDFTYTFDQDDRIVSISSLGSSSLLPASGVATAADANERVTQVGPLTLAFDDMGQTLSRITVAGQTHYVWDARGRITEATLPSGQTISYSYDPLSRLASRTINGVTTQFLYTGRDVVLDLSSDGTLVDYTNGSGLDEKLLQSSAQNGPLYFLQDHLGSTIALTGANGVIAERDQYDPFGFGPGSAFTRYGYTGRELDPATGLLFYRARWYDPQQGRFLSEDPAGLAGGSTNPYAYTNGDPVNGRDPSGEIVNLLTAVAGAAIGAGVGALATTVGTLAFSGRLPTGAELANGAISGAVTGGLIGLGGPLAGPIAGALGGGLLGAIGSGAVIGGVAGALGGAAGQSAANLIDPCHRGSVGRAAIIGGIAGGVSGGAVSGISAGLSSGATVAVEDEVNTATQQTANQIGTAGEEAVSDQIGIPRNTGPGRVTVPGDGPGGYRVPDFDPDLTIPNRGTVVEVKNVQSLQISDQIRNLAEYAESRGVPLEIFTNGKLPQSGELFNLIKNGDIIITPIK